MQKMTNTVHLKQSNIKQHSGLVRFTESMKSKQMTVMLQ